MGIQVTKGDNDSPPDPSTLCGVHDCFFKLQTGGEEELDPLVLQLVQS